jgi:hypothetical protein
MSKASSTDHGTDYKAALNLFRDHDGLPANRVSAKEAIERHAQHWHTEVVSVTRRQPVGGAGRIDIKFADGSTAHVAFGFMHHSCDVPGTEPHYAGGFDTWLPENRRHSEGTATRPIATAECSCEPGLRQPIGTPCGSCGEIVART